jgi:hypothetical protein
VVALVGEAPFETDVSTSRGLKSYYFLDRTAVALPQWENGVTVEVKQLLKYIGALF